MHVKILMAAVVLTVATSAYGAPELSVVPQGLQSGNWVWRIDVGPDFSLSPDGSPLALELGFRLIGAPLIGATVIDPAQFGHENPGSVIFGWEDLPNPPGSGNCDRDMPGNCPVGLQINTANGEIFAAYGSVNFTNPGPKPFLHIVALGPTNGGASMSTIEWLGAYGGKGRIAQLTPSGPFSSANFDIYAGSAIQVIPEPVAAILSAIAAASSVALGRRQSRTNNRTK